MEKTGGEFKEVGLAGLAILHIELPRLVYWVKLYCMVRRATVIATTATTQILFQLSEIQGKPNRMQHRDFQLKSVPGGPILLFTCDLVSEICVCFIHPLKIKQL